MLGIERDYRLVYEGSGFFGYGVWPSPVISIATHLGPDWSTSSLPSATDLGLAPLVFREDSYDPVTRLRRGRFYITTGTQPQEWHVQMHPAFSNEPGPFDSVGNRIKNLFSFQPWSAFHELRTTPASLVALGTSVAFTLWKVVDIERIATNEDMVTLRARSAMGVLPELQHQLIPENGREKVIETFDKVIEAAYRAGPESVIDRCRDATQSALGVWMSAKLGDDKFRGVELGEQTRKLENQPNLDNPVVIASIGKTIARLHARCKPNVQINMPVRIPVEDDAEAAIGMLGLLIRELGWSS